MKKQVRIAAISLLTIALVALWLNKVDLSELGRQLSSASPLLILLAVLAGCLHVPLRAWRWRVLLEVEDAGQLSLRQLMSCTAIGYLVTFAIPGRLGEIVRPGLLAAREKIVPLGVALASILIERVLDTLTLLAFTLVFLLGSPDLLPQEARERLLLFALVLIIAGVLGLLAHRFLRPRLEQAVRWIASKLPPRFEPRLRHLGLAFLAGFDALWRPGAWWRLPVYSLVVWSTPTLLFWFCIEGVNLEVAASAPLLMVGVSALGIAVPTPGGVGAFQYMVTWGLHDVLGGNAEAAGAVAILSHFASLVPIILLALYFFWSEGLSVSTLKAAASGQADAPKDQTS